MDKELVSSDLISESASVEVGLCFPDFNEVRRRTYVRRIDVDILDVLYLQSLKGLRYAFRWAVSLSYVPTLQGEKLKWHRTDRSIAHHLWASSSHGVSIVEGESRFRSDLSDSMAMVRSEADDWFNRTSSLDGILAEARLQSSGALTHDPDPALTAAFTLAKLGRRTEAEATMAQFIAKHSVGQREAMELSDALHATAELVDP